MKLWRPLTSLLAPLWAASRRAPSTRAAVAENRAAVARDPRFAADLHPLHRQFLAYREGLADGRPHSLQEAADRFGLDPTVARLTDEYLQARRRVHLDRAGWRAARVYSR